MATNNVERPAERPPRIFRRVSLHTKQET